MPRKRALLWALLPLRLWFWLVACDLASTDSVARFLAASSAVSAALLEDS